MCKIRKYQHSDLDAVISAWERASRVAYPFLDEAFFAQEKKDIPEVYLPNADTWVVETDQEVVGFIALIGNEVGAIFIQPSHHGQGLGYALMNKARELYGVLELEVFKDNAIGRAFYARYGFVPIAEKIHEATGHVLLRLRYAGPDQGRRLPPDQSGV